MKDKPHREIFFTSMATLLLLLGKPAFLKMEKKWFLLPLLFLHLVSPAAPFGVGGGVGLGIGSGGSGVWVGGGIGRTPEPPGAATTTTKLDMAYNALQAWKSAISQDPRGILRSWVGPNVCSYKGVFCSGGATVVGIDLNRANLGGVLVKELALLTDMKLLHLNSNRFSGGVPTAFENWISLQELDLSNNLLAGPFPAATLYMQSLIYLDLRFNSFSGPIPDDLFTRRLDAILLNDNHFSGELPQTLANSQASVINLANNKLTGEIPASFGFMNSKIKEILLLNNQLTGCIPSGVGLFSDMQVLDVSFNSLAGHLPDTISCLGQIEVLNLAHNRLSGMLPEIVCSLKSLLNLTVAYNFFSGFSQECGSRGNLGFDFAGNCIPNRQLQRPQPECSVPGSSLSCLRIPVVPPIVCSVAAALSGGVVGDLTALSSSSSVANPSP